MSHLEKVDQISEESYINACYIKSPLKESPMDQAADEPYGLVIATQGPKE